MSHPDWHTDAYPELRARPPWVMQEMIEAQPSLLAELLTDPPAQTAVAAQMLADALAEQRPVTICGCGTSEHAADAIAALLRAAVGSEHEHLIQARPALDAALNPRAGVCLAVSHDGETHATALALRNARAAGAGTIAITHHPQSSIAAAAEYPLMTPRHDDSWCHTVAYTSAIATGALLATELGSPAADPAAARELLAHANEKAHVKLIASALADRRTILCTGAGTDHTTARELALKIAEGAYQPTLALELETTLHGQLAGSDPQDALILVGITDHPDRDRIARRAAHVASAATAIGVPVAGLLSSAFDEALPDELTPAGRFVLTLPAADQVDRTFAGLLAGAGALQNLTLELAHARGTNPDLIRRDQAPYRHAAEAAESAGSW